MPGPWDEEGFGRLAILGGADGLLKDAGMEERGVGLDWIRDTIASLFSFSERFWALFTSGLYCSIFSSYYFEKKTIFLAPDVPVHIHTPFLPCPCRCHTLQSLMGER